MSTTNDPDHPPPSTTVNVLVTGFGPFLDTHPINPSFEIASRLPATHAHPSLPFPIRILAHPTPIRVSYANVRTQTPHLLPSSPPIDLVLHIGMADGQSHYSLERRARRDVYHTFRDVDARLCDESNPAYPDDPGHAAVTRGVPEVLAPTLDIDEVMLWWRAAVGFDGHLLDLRSSGDAGAFLCEYIFFNSLVEWGRRNGGWTEGRNGEARPVLFLHVPPQSDEEALRRGVAVALALVGAAAELLVRDREVKRDGDGVGRV